jgi:hypothetical protein
MSTVSFDDKCQAIVNLVVASEQQDTLKAWYQAFELTCNAVIAFSDGYFDNFTARGIEQVETAFGTLAELLLVTDEKLLDIALATE